MSIPVMLIVFTYLGIQFKDLYQLKYLKLSEQQAENNQEEHLFEEIEAPTVDLASNSMNFDASEEEYGDFNSSEKTAPFSTELNHELLADGDAFEEYSELSETSIEEKKDNFISGLPEKTLELAIRSIDEPKLAYLVAKSTPVHIPTASPSLLAFKPVPYVRIPSEDLISEVESEMEDLSSDSMFEGEDQ